MSKARSAERSRIVINADDLGFAPGVNRGILECHLAGTLSSASIMVTAPAFHEAVALVHERMPNLGVGLHFNLLTGKPLAVVPSLTDPATGEFLSLGKLAARAMTGRVSAADVRRECDAQLAALAKTRIAITHLDSHRHTHALPGILAPVLASVRAARVKVVRRPVDVPNPREPMTAVKMFVLRTSWDAASASLGDDDRELIARSPAFRGIALQGQADVKQRLLALLDEVRGGTEIMLHPGYDDAVLAAQDPYRTEREREVLALTSVEVKERVRRGDIKLVRFDQR
ncbi:MAG: ChbG/HpnK family deacetylase [Gemmatimonadaceae bacterium]